MNSERSINWLFAWLAAICWLEFCVFLYVIFNDTFLATFKRFRKTAWWWKKLTRQWKCHKTATKTETRFICLQVNKVMSPPTPFQKNTFLISFYKLVILLQMSKHATNVQLNPSRLCFWLHNLNVGVFLAITHQRQKWVKFVDDGEENSGDVEDPTEDKNVWQVCVDDLVEQNSDFCVQR